MKATVNLATITRAGSPSKAKPPWTDAATALLSDGIEKREAARTDATFDHLRRRCRFKRIVESLRLLRLDADASTGFARLPYERKNPAAGPGLERESTFGIDPPAIDWVRSSVLSSAAGPNALVRKHKDLASIDLPDPI